MTNNELVRELTALVRDRIVCGWHRMGIRVETEDLSREVRSKTVRAYIVDLFGDYGEVDGLHDLEDAIDDSIN